MKLKSLLALALAGATASLPAADVNVSGSITSNTTWTADNIYNLSGYVFVAGGSTLTIEPGTVVKGAVSTGAGAAALVVTAGSKIMAEGTADKPIIFTSALDNLDGSLGSDRKGLWGGLIVLGNASINSRSDKAATGTPTQDQIEGMSVSTDQIPLITFGGTNDADNSGIIKYVSIRHGGATIGTGNEINGLTMGGVGSGTTVSYVEVYSNQDDGFEFFGGTVNGDHLVAAFCGDDSFDFDQGFRGSLQWLFTVQIQDGEPGDKAIEWDGATSPLTATPISNVTVSNLTAIGLGTSGTGDGSNAPINPRDAATVNLHNSVFVNYERGIEIESDIGNVAPVISSNVWWSHVSANNTTANWGTSQGSSSDQDATSYFTTASLNNSIADPMLKGIAYTAGSQGLDPRASGATSPIWTLPTVALTGLTATDYVGAFGNNLWISGWTNLAIAGYLPIDLGGGDDPVVSITEDTSVAIVRGSSSKAVNLSSRSDVTTSSPITAGFVIGGSQAQTVLIRAVGPSLANFGVANPLSNVQLQLFEPGATTPLVTSSVVTTQSVALSAELGAFALTAGSEDATLVAVLSPGAYTAIVSGVDGAVGNALVEIYELD
ncbi:MAG: hypothetical protein QNK90_07400 [Opitutaceae bacterium]|tara:strand:+ start:26509 stop:28323 length:1815 start_codon:yes stop_codon:yes gene_type:complete